ncbi:MAG: type II secretion system protein GspG [Verrucomicrobia bacterium]|nr:type II secretion system protein GspG [Verrucomicrobiota bacterium]MCF7709357.1 type II secretion system protein GspG [Verrucomicrobiota bacterium]
MNVKINKWGNSLAIRIPSSIARNIHITEGEDVEMKEEGDRIVLEPRRHGGYNLESMLSQVSDENIHGEFQPVTRDDRNTAKSGDEEMRKSCIKLYTAMMSIIMLAGCTAIPDDKEESRREDVRTVMKEEITQNKLLVLSDALDIFEVDCGRFPTAEEGLDALIENPGIDGWRGPYVKVHQGFIDQWGTSIKYDRIEGEGFILYSAGADKEFGTADDIEVDR